MRSQLGILLVRFVVLSFLAAALGGCEEPQPNIIGEGDSDNGNNNNQRWIGNPPPAPWDTLTWGLTPGEQTRVETTGDPGLPAGIQGELLADSAGRLFYVYYKFERDGEPCSIAAFGGGPAPNAGYYLHVAVRQPGAATWTVEAVPLEQQGGKPHSSARFGIDAEIDNSDRLVIAVAAGGTGLFTCGSAELVLATRTAPNAYTIFHAVSSSGECCDDRTGCTLPGLECCNDPACRDGAPGDIGAWAALAIRPDGGRAVAYGDQHNFGTEDGQTQQGLELWEDGASPVGIRPYAGMGRFTALEYPGTTPIVAFTGFETVRGLHVLRRTGTANDGNDWEEVSLGIDYRNYTIGERIRIEKAPDGTIGLVFQAIKDSNGDTINDLFYCSSNDDGATWNGCTSVGAKVWNIGGNPSLTYSADSKPRIAHQYCGVSALCPSADDGLMFSFQADNGLWYHSLAHSVSSTRSGFYSGVVVDPSTGVPTVAFQDLTNGAAITFSGSFE